MVVEELERIQAPLTYSWGCVGHLMGNNHSFVCTYSYMRILIISITYCGWSRLFKGVKNSPELRTAHEAMQPKVVKVYQQIGQSQALFKALNELKSRNSIWSVRYFLKLFIYLLFIRSFI